MAYTQYKGSPDIFDTSTGRYIPNEEALKLGIVKPGATTGAAGVLSPDVTVSQDIRPDIKTEADFARLAGIDLNKQPADQSATDLYNQGAVTTSQTPEEAKAQAEQAQVKQTIAALQQKILDSFSPSAEERQLQNELFGIKKEEAATNVADINRPALESYNESRINKTRRDAAIIMAPLVDRLNSLSSERGQVAQKAQIAIQLQQATLPEVLKTDVNQDTGEVYSIVRDPVTGAIRTQLAGHITPTKKDVEYASTSQDVAADGSKIFTGITKDGRVVREIIAPPGTFRVAGSGGTSGELSDAKKAQYFNQIVGQYNKSPLVLAADRTPVLRDAVTAIRKTPNNGALQLNLAYAYVQALDTYQSAVREGELSLVNSIDSKVGQLGNYISQIQNGQIVRPEVAKQIADAADTILTTIYNAAKAKEASFKSQANVVGVGQEFNQYLSGFQPSYNTGGGQITNAPDPDATPIGGTYTDPSTHTIYLRQGKDNFIPVGTAK